MADEVKEPSIGKADDNLSKAAENPSQVADNVSQATEEGKSIAKESPSIINIEEKSQLDLNTLLGFESEECSESKHESEIDICPFGEDYVPLNPNIIDENKKLLGVIRLYWPPSPDISLKHFPDSYKSNSNKEKVLLLYAENFRKQYHSNFPTKKPLLLAAENECGVQKMVSTTIRPTKLCYPELHSWQGCANFISDHIVYEPLHCPHLMVGA